LVGRDTRAVVADRNEALLENLQQVSSDIAHDMRTPLARLRNVLDAAMRQDLTADQAKDALAHASRHAEDLLDLFAALLRISEIESLQVRSAFQPTNLSAVAERCIDALRPDVEADGYRLAADLAPDIMLDGDRHLLSQLIVNLIENAARHTPPGSRIEVRLGLVGDQAELSVSDNGPGIPADQYAFVLRRFSRLEQSRNKPGNGLGLNLATAVARAHFSELRLSDAAPGLVVALSLPLRAPGRTDA
jgi:signal transduction histidine kinase